MAFTDETEVQVVQRCNQCRALLMSVVARTEMSLRVNQTLGYARLYRVEKLHQGVPLRCDVCADIENVVTGQGATGTGNNLLGCRVFAKHEQTRCLENRQTNKGPQRHVDTRLAIKPCRVPSAEMTGVEPQTSRLVGQDLTFLRWLAQRQPRSND